MNNKVLVSVEIPEISSKFEVFLPVNEQIWKISKLICKIASDLVGGNLDIKSNYVLINKNDGTMYQSNMLLIETNIRNGSELIMLNKSVNQQQ